MVTRALDPERPHRRPSAAVPNVLGSGCYGSGEEFAPFIDLARIGGVVLKSVTRAPRLGNVSLRTGAHAGRGTLNAIGPQNPCIDYYLTPRPRICEPSVRGDRERRGFSVDDYAYVSERYAARDEIAALEVNISCPNVANEGETFACHPKLRCALSKRCA